MCHIPLWCAEGQLYLCALTTCWCILQLVLVFFNRDFPATSYQVIVFALFWLLSVKTSLLSTV